MMLEKDPDDTLDYTIDWALWLQPGEIIMAAEVAGKNSLVATNTTHTDTEVTCWLSGGAGGIMYYPQCTIETSQGRTVQRSFPLWVRNK